MATSITLAGNLTRDPEQRFTTTGTSIVEVTVASSEGKDKTIFMTCKFIGNKAGEIIAKYAKKGSGVFISGSLDEEVWEKDGQKKSKFVCIANSFNFLSSGPKQESAPAKTQPKPAAKNTPVEDGDFEDIPF